MITIKLNLTALKNVKMIKKGKNGNEVKGIFIPITENSLFESERTGAIYLDLIAFEMKDKTYATHIVKQSFSKEERVQMTEEQIKNLPIFGNLTIIDNNISEVNNSPIAGTLSEDDNVPW